MTLPTRLRHTRLGRRHAEIRVVQEASASIIELGETLDRRLVGETRESERLRMLRETTNQVTRTANDAVQAYARLRSALSVEMERPEGDHETAHEMQRLLLEARGNVLDALEALKRRHAWGFPDADEDTDSDEPGAPPALTADSSG